jgi:cyclopropane-fatty-acyl-phospholipid synthase
MSVTVAVNPAAGPVLAILDRLCEGYAPRDFAVRLVDETIVDADAGQPVRFTFILRHPGALREMIWPFNKASVGEAYIFDDIDVEGDIEAFLGLMRHWARRREELSAVEKIGLLRQILGLPRQARPRSERWARLSGGRRTLARDRQAVQYHYDGPPSDFFAIFLDRHMQYSCGYFADPDDSIDAAQEQKLDYICRKLDLKAGERLIDFGCGWGGLIAFAARNYGVRTLGVSVSQKQIEWCNREIDAHGLRGRCRVEYMDYRTVPETEPFDKAVSVGFIEHVGEKMFPTFFGKVHRLLRPGGLYLHHGITFRPFTPFPPWRAFALKYVFPDGELVPITNTVDHMAGAGFEVRDVENLREHYALTLRRWLRRLEERHADAVRLADEVTYRIHRIYFAGAIHGFRTGIYNLYQTLVVKSAGDVSALPLTRAAWYR